ncbi:hypothetical protein EMCRGX_G034972 [Ephydatia muelleri]
MAAKTLAFQTLEESTEVLEVFRSSGTTDQDVMSPISTELSRLSNSSSNPSIVGLAEVVLDSKGDHTRPVKDWLYLWLKFYLKFEIFYAPKFRLEKINSWQSCLPDSWKDQIWLQFIKDGEHKGEARL